MAKKTRTLSPQRLMPGPDGVRTLSCSVDFCTRCNACVQSCPSYLLRQEEAFSPRGRNQIIRLLLEGKIKTADNKKLIRQTASSCFLCARCTSACAAALPVAQHVLALRQAAACQTLPFMLKQFIGLYGMRPALFHLVATLCLGLRRLGLLTFLRVCAITRLPFLHWLNHADDILPRTAAPLSHVIKKQKTVLFPQKPDIIYYPSLEAQYADPQIGLRTLQLLKPKQVYMLSGQASGLFEYLYGTDTLALKQAKNLLLRWESISGRRKLTLVTDGLETYLFLKHFPVLFASWPGWQKRAEDFAVHVSYITELPSSVWAGRADITTKTALDSSSSLFPADKIAERTRKILKTHLGKNFVECEYSRFVIPGAGNAFVLGTPSREVILENVKDVARLQLKQVYCLSGWAALELNAALRRHYPQAQARHVVYLQAKP